MKKKRLLTISILVIVILVVINIKVPTYKGINYVVKMYKIPLYVKGIHFLSRYFQFKEIVNDITKGIEKDEDKILAIFDWVHENIKSEIPEGLPIIDDHVLNVIIRGYGASDQIVDVFCALCAYEKIPAKRHNIYIEDKKDNKKKRLIIALVNLDGEWAILDPYNGNYFKNEDGNIATIDELLANPTLKNQSVNKSIVSGIEYAKYFENLSPVSNVKFLRSKKQIPFWRIFYEIKKAISYGR